MLFAPSLCMLLFPQSRAKKERDRLPFWQQNSAPEVSPSPRPFRFTPGQFSSKINNLSEDTSTYFRDIYIIITGRKILARISTFTAAMCSQIIFITMCVLGTKKCFSASIFYSPLSILRAILIKNGKILSTEIIKAGGRIGSPCE